MVLESFNHFCYIQCFSLITSFSNQLQLISGAGGSTEHLIAHIPGI